MILIKIFNFCWKIANKLIYIGVYVESRGFCLASPPNIFFISKLIIIDWSITLCDVTPKSRIQHVADGYVICVWFSSYQYPCQSCQIEFSLWWFCFQGSLCYEFRSIQCTCICSTSEPATAYPSEASAFTPDFSRFVLLNH